MPKLQIISEHQLDDWVSKNEREAQTLIVELISKLISVSCPNATHQNIPLHVNQPGPDGEVITDFGFKGFIPDGRSLWEVKTSRKAGVEATEAYNYYTATIPEDVRMESAFIFVTPRSSARDWQNTWKEEGIAQWTKTREDRNEWNAIKVINGSILTDWLSYFPGLGQWFASRILGLRFGFETGYSRWEVLRSYGNPPPLGHELFTSGRDEACQKLTSMLIQQESSRLRIDTRYPDHVADFVAAYLQTLDDEKQAKFLPRILIFPSEDGWREACSLHERHVLVADFDIDSKRGSQLLQLATSSGHAVIHSGYPGGLPHGNACELFPPKVHEIKEALVKIGYTEERARMLTNKSGRDLNLLLRLIQGLSELPDWATQSEAVDLAIAQFIAQWEEANPGDHEAIGELVGKSYGEWMINIRKAASAKSAPLEFAIGRWKFTSRYEPWLYLGNHIGAEQLERFSRMALKVLSEPNPELELPKSERFAASIYGKVRIYSKRIREGIAETLALLGSHGTALKSCREGLPEEVAYRVIRELLDGADSMRWASLNDILPLLAEASPGAFLSAVSAASKATDSPFKGVFSEEADGFLGGTFITGLLWALESLAWSEHHFLDVCEVLGDLAAIDPGGTSSNRPNNTLVSILLPWFPQTTARSTMRYAAVQAIVDNHPQVGWELLLHLLPKRHQSSVHTHRPKWRDFVPENWEDGATNGQRWEDEGFYADMALKLARDDPDRLGKLLPFYFYVHTESGSFRDVYRNRLVSDPVLNLPEEKRLMLWTKIATKTANHRKYATSEAWAVPEALLQELDEVADRIKPLAPEIRHRRLFSGVDAELYEDAENWDEQQKILLQKRTNALLEIQQRGGLDALRDFWRSVEDPRDVGFVCGASDALGSDEQFLPALLDSETESDKRFVLAYISSRFHTKSWGWVDSIDRSEWGIPAKADFFSVLPSIKEVWERAEVELGESNAAYWERARIRPIRDITEGFEHAIRQLIANGRCDTAIQCFWLGNLWDEPYPELALKALEAFDHEINHLDVHAVQEVFEHLQKLDTIDEDRLATMEVKFLSVLDSHLDASPHTLFRLLADRPEFFCELIQMVFRSKNTAPDDEEHQKVDDKKASAAGNGYRILRNWNHPPGLKRDGSFDRDHLKTWIASVKEVCIPSGHWEVAAHQIGQMFFHAPKDDKGLWIEPVCEVVDSKDEAEIRRGLEIQIYNSRGACFHSGGREENVLAETWEGVASQAESKGYFRLGATLRSVAQHYRDEAKRSVAEHRHLFD